MKIDRSIVAITGAAGGLGAAMAERLAKQGARLALLDFNPDALEAFAGSLGLPAEDVRSIPCDVSDETQVDEAFAAIREHFGGLDLLINNAGITRDALMLKFKDGELQSRMSLDHWNAVIGGLVINISSISRAGNMGQSNYSAAKAGVAAMTVTWAKEFARYGVRVNTISPGFIGTEMVRSMKPEALAKLQGMIPAGRIGEPDEIAHTVQFIMENDFVNGRNIEVDGGMRL